MNQDENRIEFAQNADLNGVDNLRGYVHGVLGLGYHEGLSRHHMIICVPKDAYHEGYILGCDEARLFGHFSRIRTW
jgi:hypothetical protein